MAPKTEDAIADVAEASAAARARADVVEREIAAEAGRLIDCFLANEVVDFVVAMPATSAPIEKRSEVCGGEACLTGTRIPVWLLEQARRLKTPKAQLLRSYPSLTADMLTEAWAYAKAHGAEIDEAIKENEAD